MHETDPDRNGCEFGHFFKTTPQDLIDGGIYGPLAINMSWGPHRSVSLALAAREIGAAQGKSGGFASSIAKGAKSAAKRLSTTPSAGKKPISTVEVVINEASSSLDIGETSSSAEVPPMAPPIRAVSMPADEKPEAPTTMPAPAAAPPPPGLQERTLGTLPPTWPPGMAAVGPRPIISRQGSFGRVTVRRKKEETVM